jgi:hypothetical protein
MIRVSAKDPVWTAFSFDPMPITLRSTHRRISWPLAEWWRCHLPTGILPVLLPWMRWCLTDLALAPENKLSINLGCCGGTARPQVHVSGHPAGRMSGKKPRSGLVGSAPHCPTCPTWGRHSHHIILWARQLKTLFSVHWHVVSRKLVRCEPPTAADGM